MSYQDDPNINRRPPVTEARESNTGMWIAGIVAACLVVGLIAFASTRNSDTAMNNPPATTTTTPPATTTGSGTTGSGASTMPNNPNGTTVQRDRPASQPAPQR